MTPAPDRHHGADRDPRPRAPRAPDRGGDVMIDDDYDYDIEELHQEVAAEKRYYNQLIRHPNPQDPDYPELDDDDE